MVYRGHVQNGVIIVDDDVRLPEGAQVELSLIGGPTEGAPPIPDPVIRLDATPTIEDVLARIAADVPDSEWAKLPDDLNDQLDHYVYGTPKR